MAVAEIIGASIGVLLLVMVAYLLVGGTLNAAETAATAQKDLTLLEEARLRTSITISDIEPTLGGNTLNFSVTNNGNEIIPDLPHMDVFSFNTTNGYMHYTYVKNEAVPPEQLDPATMADYTWSDTWYENDHIHTRELDPNVTMRIMTKLPAGVTPDNIQVITSNGVSAVSNVPT